MSQWSVDPPAENFRRVLAPDGSLVGDPPDVADDELRDWYATLVLTRRFEAKFTRMQRRGEISVAADSRGEEAVALGTGAALSPGDWYYPSYRQTSGLLHHDVAMDRVVAGLMGAEPETVNEHLPADGDTDVTVAPSLTPLAVNIANAVGTAMVDAFAAAEAETDPDTVTMAYIGEGATSEGDFHEALNFAGVFDVPGVIVCQNNQWAISVPSDRQTAADTFAQRAEAHGVPAMRVDGNDVLATYAAGTEAVERARAGGGPTLIEAVTNRRSDHNTADDESVYRENAHRDYWEARDPVDRFETYLRERGVLDDETIEAIESAASRQVDAAVERARDVPRSDPMRLFDNHLTRDGWSHRHQRWELERELGGDNPYVDETGELAPSTSVEPATAAPQRDGPETTMVEAIRSATAGELARDGAVRLLGYDVGPIGGVFRATEGLYDRFGPTRVVDTPLSESALVGTAVGMAMRGERPLVEIQFMGFLYPAFGQVQYTLAKMHERTAGGFDVPVTLRIPYGGGIKASEFHSESTEVYLAHTPGLRVVVPSTPAEAKGLLAASVRSDDPVAFLEPKRLYREATGPVPEASYEVSLDEARLVRPGTDVTVVAWGAMVREAQAAADAVGADVEILDLRTLSPLDVGAILASVRKTGRLVILHEARRTAGLGAEIASLVNEYAFDRLKAPVRRATGFDVHFPGHQLEDVYLPDSHRATHAIRGVMEYAF